VLILAKRSDSLPLLFEQAVMDIETSEGNMERINTYVHMVQSNGVGIDANSINVLLKYVDQDPEKLAQLSKFIASVR
jgi:L-lysine 2,3-aminomutase